MLNIAVPGHLRNCYGNYKIYLITLAQDMLNRLCG